MYMHGQRDKFGSWLAVNGQGQCTHSLLPSVLMKAYLLFLLAVLVTIGIVAADRCVSDNFGTLYAPKASTD